MSLVSGKGVAYACAYACAHQLLVLVPRAAGRDIIHQRTASQYKCTTYQKERRNIKKKVVPRRNPIVPRILLV